MVTLVYKPHVSLQKSDSIAVKMSSGTRSCTRNPKWVRKHEHIQYATLSWFNLIF